MVMTEVTNSPQVNIVNNISLRDSLLAKAIAKGIVNIIINIANALKAIIIP